MKKYVIFYYLASAYDEISVYAESFQGAIAIADAFKAKFGAVIVGICPELLLNMYCHGE